MTCETCRKHRVKITTPTDLKRALEEVSDLLLKNEIEFIGSKENQTYFNNVLKSKAWGDFVEFHFLCTSCGQELCLYAETFHGSGGAFKDIEKGRTIYAGYHT